MQPGHIYYKLYNILYGSEKHTISIKVGKIYYINGKIDLCYIKRYTTMDILYKVMFSTLPSTHSAVWYYILKDNGINVLQLLNKNRRNRHNSFKLTKMEKFYKRRYP